MFERTLKMPQVLNGPRFWIWDGCLCKGYTEFWICLEYGLTCLNNENTSGMNTPYIPQYAWPWLNIAGCPWDIRISPNKLFRHARVLNMPHLIYLTGFLKMPQKLNIPEFWICHDIVIITLLQKMLFIILEFLFAPFVHPGAPQLTILSFFNTS